MDSASVCYRTGPTRGRYTTITSATDNAREEEEEEEAEEEDETKKKKG